MSRTKLAGNLYGVLFVFLLGTIFFAVTYGVFIVVVRIKYGIWLP